MSLTIIALAGIVLSFAIILAGIFMDTKKPPKRTLRKKPA
jgi:hypothetical protein